MSTHAYTDNEKPNKSSKMNLNKSLLQITTFAQHYRGIKFLTKVVDLYTSSFPLGYCPVYQCIF